MKENEKRVSHLNDLILAEDSLSDQNTDTGSEIHDTKHKP